jgi:hypothetical protein
MIQRMRKQLEATNWKNYLAVALLCALLVTVMIAVPLKATSWNALASAIPKYVGLALLGALLVSIVLGVPLKTTVRNLRATVWKKKNLVIVVLFVLLVVILPGVTLKVMVWNMVASAILGLLAIAVLSALLMSIIPGWKNRYLTLALIGILLVRIILGVRCM